MVNWPCSHPAQLAVFSVLAMTGLGCCNSNGASDNVGSTEATIQTSSGRPSSDTTAAADDSTTGDSTTDVQSSGGDPKPTSSNPCERYIECAVAVGDVPLSPIVGLYGPEGECWDNFEDEVCFQDCIAGFSALAQANPDVEACFHCENDADCSVFDFACYQGVCRTPLEGNGDIDAACYSAEDCMKGLECIYLIPDHSPGRCKDTCGAGGDADCVNEGWICDPSLERCREPECSDATTCEECFALGCFYDYAKTVEDCPDIPPDWIATCYGPDDI